MRLKICGITREEDAREAARLGYHLCGFVFHQDSPRHISMEQAAATHTGPMLRVGVFVNQDLQEIRAFMARARLDYAQLHGGQGQDIALALGLDHVIRVLWPGRYASLKDMEADAAAKPCAFYLLESGASGGGSGRAMSQGTWQNLASLHLPMPFFLAGGLNQDNAAQAAKACNPAGMDINSGAEDMPGIKNHTKMAAIAAALREL